MSLRPAGWVCGLRLNRQQIKGTRIPQKLLVTNMFGISAWRGLPIPWGDTAVQSQSVGGWSPPLQEPSGHLSGGLCPLLLVTGFGGDILDSDRLTFPRWLAIGCCLLVLRAHPSRRFSPHSGQQLRYRVQPEGKPMWPVPTTCPTTVQIYWFLRLITHWALSSGHMEWHMGGPRVLVAL